MSYGQKYKMSWYDRCDRLNEVYFREEDYAGASENVTSIGESPALLEVNAPGDDPYERVTKGTTARFFLKDSTGFKYLELFTATKNKYHVQWDIAASLFWAGWVAQDLDQHPYSVAPYGVEILCTDGLAVLRSYDVSLTGKQSLMAILAHCLSNIRTDDVAAADTLYENLTKYEEHHDQADADSPLTQTFIDCDNFFYDDDGNAMNCYDAVNKVFFSWGVILRQSSGAWHLLQLNISGSSYRRREYTLSAGSYSYSSNELHSPIIQTNGSTNRLLVPGTILNMSAWKKFKITQDYGKKENIIENYNFTEWSGSNNPDGWTKIGTNVTRSGDRMRLEITGEAFDQNKHIYQSIASIEETYGQKFNIKVKYKVYCPKGHSCTLRFSIKLTNGLGYNYWYNFGVNNWDSEFSKKDLLHNATSETIAKDETFELGGCQLGGVMSGLNTITVYIYRAISTISDAYIEVDEMGITILLYDHVMTMLDPDEEKLNDIEINPNHNVSQEYQTIIGDAPRRVPFNWPIENAGHIYNNILLYLDGSNYLPTINWDYKDGGNNYELLIQKLITEISQFRATPKMLVQSRMITENLDPVTIVQDQYNNDKKFFLHQGIFNAKLCVWDVELYEMPAPLEPLYDETDAVLVDEHGDDLYG